MSLIDDIDEEEGFRGSAYQDSRGYWTIGYGTCIDGRVGCEITREEAAILRDNRLALARQDLISALPWAATLSSARLDALVDLTYNLGIEKFLHFDDFLPLMQHGMYAEAAEDLRNNTLWAKQVQKSRVDRICDAIING